jgi:hypothetical protein
MKLAKFEWNGGYGWKTWPEVLAGNPGISCDLFGNCSISSIGLKGKLSGDAIKWENGQVWNRR